MKHNRDCYGKSVAVIIPCFKGEEESLFHKLEHWWHQIYSNYQIVIVNYGASKSLYGMIRERCNRHHKSIDAFPFSSSNCLYLDAGVKDSNNFCHAINFAITKTKSDILVITTSQRIPKPYCLDGLLLSMDDRSYVRTFCTLCCDRTWIEDINGLPENFNSIYPAIVDKYELALDVVSVQLSAKNHSIKVVENFFLDDIKSCQIQECVNDYFAACPLGYNNNGNPYGDFNPVLLVDKKDIKDISDIIVPNKLSFYGKRLAIVVTCKNREDNLRSSLPMWLGQLYQNKQIVVVDYSSDGDTIGVVNSIAKDLQLSVCNIITDQYDYDSDIVYIRVPGVKFFNISHAYNFAIERIQFDVVQVVCADSCPRDYYSDLVMNSIDDNSFVQTWWGLQAITNLNWRMLNGYQEFVVGWGGEDDDFRIRASMLGLTIKILPSLLIFQIEQEVSEKGKEREIKDTFLSSKINMTRFETYIAQLGYSANYGGEIGRDFPVQYAPISNDVHCISCCMYKTGETPLLPGNVRYLPEYNIYYTEVTNDSVQWTQWVTWGRYGATRHNGVVPVYDIHDNKCIDSAGSRFHREALNVKE